MNCATTQPGQGSHSQLSSGSLVAGQQFAGRRRASECGRKHMHRRTWLCLLSRLCARDFSKLPCCSRWRRRLLAALGPRLAPPPSNQPTRPPSGFKHPANWPLTWPPIDVTQREATRALATPQGAPPVAAQSRSAGEILRRNLGGDSAAAAAANRRRRRLTNKFGRQSRSCQPNECARKSPSIQI